MQRLLPIDVRIITDEVQLNLTSHLHGQSHILRRYYRPQVKSVAAAVAPVMTRVSEDSHGCRGRVIDMDEKTFPKNKKKR